MRKCLTAAALTALSGGNAARIPGGPELADDTRR